MSTQAINDYHQGVEVYKGDELCKKKLIELLEELCLSKGLLPLEDIDEFGYNREASFMWLIQKKKKDHVFKKIKRAVSYATEVTTFVEKKTKRAVSYATEVTMFVEKYKLKKMTGVKMKELLVWLSIVEVYFEKPTSEKLTFKTGTGLSDSLEALAFEL